MKIALFPSSPQLRDAGEVAFGILVFAILLIPCALMLAMLAATVLFAFWFPFHHPFDGNTARDAGFGIWGIFWIIGMGFVLRHYRRATCTWTTERRGGPMLFLVECISASVSLAGESLVPSTDGSLDALKFYLAGFLLLLVCSHVATYALLRYRPTLKEWIVWPALCVAVVMEMIKAH